MSSKYNPYELGPVDNPRLLRTRRSEIRRVIEKVAPTSGRAGHALILGEERTGRTSTLQEVGRRVGADRRCLVVRLHLLEDDLTSSGLPRALLNAVVEALVEAETSSPDWYLAWCERVHLRNRSTASVRDLLISGLAFAADDAAVLDRAVLCRDLKTLSRLAAELEYTRIVVSLDDADALLEDVSLVENLLDVIDAVGRWSLVMSTRPAGLVHLQEAMSPSLRRFAVIWLLPFWTPDAIRTCLAAPLDAAEAQRFMPGNQMGLLMDLLHLTGGNPFEIALVARYLWMGCRLGEQEHYELTPRVLERALTQLAIYTGAEDTLVDGARAVQDLDPRQLSAAIDLVALSRLTTRQVAIARLLGLPNATNKVSDRLLTADVEETEARVVEELEALEAQGVVALDGQGGFAVEGGSRATVALKYHARSLLGPEAADKPFGITYLHCVGEPLAEDYVSRVIERRPDIRRLGSTSALSSASGSSGARLRAAIDAKPFVGLDVDAFPVDEAAHDRMVELVLDHTLGAVAVVDFTLASGTQVLDWFEIWEVPIATSLHEVNQAMSDALDDWQVLVAAADVQWQGSHAVRFEGQPAREALIQLCPPVAESGLRELWPAWLDTDRSVTPDQALELVETTVRALRAHRVPDWERGWELSTALSYLGFLLAFYPDRLQDARGALEQARAHGPADGWVTVWNLAHVAARQADYVGALTWLSQIDDDDLAREPVADVVFFVPGRDPTSCVVSTDGASGQALLALQRTLLGYLAHDVDHVVLQDITAASASGGSAGATAAAWVSQSIVAPLPGLDSNAGA